MPDHPASLPKLVVFDVDMTLTKSKQPATAEMASLLSALAAKTRIAFISGGTLEQLLTQVVEHLPVPTDLTQVYILPTSGGALYANVHDAWTPVYEERLSSAEEEQAVEAIKQGVAETGIIDLAEPSYGARIEKRGAEVTFSALGQEAPLDLKMAWDPDGAKRFALRAAIAAHLPSFDVKTGGSTSIDITKRGVNKAYGIEQLASHTNIPITDMLYVGDELGSGGNDAVVLETGIPTHAVKDPDETAAFIRTLLV